VGFAVIAGRTRSPEASSVATSLQIGAIRRFSVVGRTHAGEQSLRVRDHTRRPSDLLARRTDRALNP